jgi:YbbR domain-containing protein
VDDQPAPGYEVAKVSSVPATVEVAGPASEIRTVTEATTEPVSVKGATRSVIATVTIGVPDSNVRLRNPRDAIVTVEIRSVPVERAIPQVAVQLRNVESGRNAIVQPAVVTVTVRGAAPDVDALGRGGLVVYADLAGLGAGRYNLPVRVESPRNVTIERVEPSQLDVRLR